MLGGKLAAEVVSERAIGIVSEKPIKPIQQSVIDKSKSFVPKDPMGVKGKLISYTIILKTYIHSLKLNICNDIL